MANKIVALRMRPALWLLTGVSVLSATLISGSALWGLRTQGIDQDEGIQHYTEAIQVHLAAGAPSRLYEVVGDSVINGYSPESLRAWQAEKDAITRALEQIAQTPNGLTDGHLATARKAFNEVTDLYQQDLVPLLQVKPLDYAAISVVDGRLDAARERMADALTLLAKAFEERAHQADAQFDHDQEATLLRNLILAGVALCLSVGMALWIIRNLLATLGCDPEDATQQAARIALGDLSQPLQAGARPGSLLESLNTMQTSLTGMLANIQQSARLVSGSVQELTAAAHQVAEGSSRQSDSAATMAAAIEELSTSVAQVSDNANEAHGTASEAGSRARSGGAVVAAATNEMREIAQTVQTTAELMRQLGTEASQISVVGKVIRDIADQTNLLALNAAIEAARAGEQGRGFAVVADEVRKLAERTAKSTSEIAAIVQNIQASVDKASQSMAQGITRVQQGVKLADEAGVAMTGMGSQTDVVVQAVSDISAALGEQRSASTQLAQNVENIVHMVDENAAAMSQVAGATGQLEQLAGELNRLTQQFKLRG